MKHIQTGVYSRKKELSPRMIFFLQDSTGVETGAKMKMAILLLLKVYLSNINNQITLTVLSITQTNILQLN